MKYEKLTIGNILHFQHSNIFSYSFQDDLSGLEYPGVLYSNNPRAPIKKPGREKPALKQNWEGRQPKTRDRCDTSKKVDALHAKSKASRSTGLVDIDNEVEVDY
jgi:mTERF domain-containing protein